MNSHIPLIFLSLFLLSTTKNHLSFHHVMVNPQSQLDIILTKHRHSFQWSINPSKSLCDDFVYTEVCVLLHPLDVIGGDVQFLQLFHHLSPTACYKRQRLQQIADWLIELTITWLIVFAVLRPFDDTCILHSIININFTNAMHNFGVFFFWNQI